MSTDSAVADGFWDFYSGNPGIALFLAAFSRVTDDPTYRNLCLRALKPVQDEIRRSQRVSSTPGSSTTTTIGALVGTSSWIYALLTTGSLLCDSTLLVDAHTLSTLITPERILADSYHDLVFGSAGALLVLLALDQVNSAPNSGGYTPLELAKLCARKLIATDLVREATSSDSTFKRSHFGLSHGLAGIGLALSRLYRRTHDPEVGQAIRRLLTPLLQFATADPPHPLRFRTPQAADVSWCHGAPGLSIALTEILDSDLDKKTVVTLREARQEAINWTRRAPFSPQDHLCCGNMGRVAALSYLSQKTRDPALFEAACQLAHLVLRVAKTRQGFSLDYEQPDNSFFRGFAGIAYTLLALNEPRDLPHVIALE